MVKMWKNADNQYMPMETLSDRHLINARRYTIRKIAEVCGRIDPMYEAHDRQLVSTHERDWLLARTQDELDNLAGVREGLLDEMAKRRMPLDC